MTGVPVSPRRVFGVSLRAGAAAGADTWVCRAHPGSEGIRVENVARFADLPGGCVAVEPAMHALVGKVVEAPASAWGMDFAFGLPRQTAASHAPAHEVAPWQPDWRGDVEELAGRALADAAAKASGRDRGRLTDDDHQLAAPLSELRAACTRLGVGRVLAELMGKPRVAVLPMMPLPLLPQGTPPAMAANAASTYLLEVHPQALLRRLSGEAGRDLSLLATASQQRRNLLRSLADLGMVRPMARSLRESICEEARALDALLCAVAAWRGYRGYEHGHLCRDPHYGAEGFVYC